MIKTIDYNRERAVAYATKWAYRRNPKYLDFHGIGGDCTNFVSQCMFYANNIMNYTPTYGWYYITSSDRTASWTGVQFLYNFLIKNKEAGPFAEEVEIENIEPGDIIQLGDEKGEFYHSLIVIETGENPNRKNVLVATHSSDSFRRPLDTYTIKKIRFLHIVGVRS